MGRSKGLLLIVGAALILTTGCWDMNEIDALSLWMGSGCDLVKGGKVLLSGQIAIPGKQASSQGGGDAKGKAYFVVSATGKDVQDAMQNIQTKLSRKLFTSQQRVIFFGEKLARHGLKEVLDDFTRNPDLKLRTSVFVIKGATAEEAIKLPSPLEKSPALAALREHIQVGGVGDAAFFNFLDAAAGEGSSPIMPALAISPLSSSQAGDDKGGEKEVRVVGDAIFNRDLKLVGFLNPDERRTWLWITGHLERQTLTTFIPQGGGYVSLCLEDMGSKVKPILSGDKVGFQIKLSGTGTIKENNTSLDLKQTKNLDLVEAVLQRSTEQRSLSQFRRIQKQYGTDIFGFGEAIHRKYPYRWIKMKEDWAKQFQEANVSVIVNLRIHKIGLIEQSLIP